MSKDSKKAIYIAIFIIISILGFVTGYELLTVKQGLIASTIYVLALIIGYQIYATIYFHNKEFHEIKASIENHINECNELNDHISELKRTNLNISSYDYGQGQLRDASTYKFKRSQWHKTQKNQWTHHCSAAICKSAADQPFKYLCKYFDIKTNEKTLSSLESALNNYHAAHQGRILLEEERERILLSISQPIPTLIKLFSKKRLMKNLGFSPIHLNEIEFPTYKFQYVSAGGNSSYSYSINLDIRNLEKLITYLGSIIKFRQSIEGQRSLMTQSLREKIKARDNYTCRICGISTKTEKNLLLEIDHIIPLSKGGITCWENLQTLCWKCNRSKGAKII